MNVTRILFVVSSLVSCASLSAQPIIPQPRAHAHNDYAHTMPLVDALDQGFCSVEADIFLAGEQLLVAHDLRDIRPERTLEALYLAPLRARVSENEGRVYRNGPQFWLLIDIKSEGSSTYRVLSRLLKEYADILTTYRPDRVETKAVSVVISGNRPVELIAAEAVRYAAVDGRLSDLKSSTPSELVPWISDNWTRTFRWRGDGSMPEPERHKLREIVRESHQQRRLVRFWATPDLPAVWRELVAAHVDFINADDLSGLRAFLATEQPSNR